MPTDRQDAPVPGPSNLLVCALHVRGVREEAREADFICSTAAVDSYGEIVEQDWQLERYLSNPVVLWAHQSRELPIGQAKNVGVVNGKLQATVSFASEKANPKAEQVWRSVVEKNVRAVSVGFMPGDYRFEKRDGREVLVLSKNELFEISVTPIPANPECIARMRARAAGVAQNHPPAERGGNTENDMNEKEKAALEAKIAEREAEARVLEKQLADAKTAMVALEAQTKRLTEERDAATARAEKAEGEALAREVDALVGVKIAPAEKDVFVELAKSNRTLFTKMLEQRAPLKLLAPIVPPDPNPESKHASSDSDSESIGALALRDIDSPAA